MSCLIQPQYTTHRIMHTGISTQNAYFLPDGQLFNYRDNRDYFIGNNRHRVLFLDW